MRNALRGPIENEPRVKQCSTRPQLPEADVNTWPSPGERTRQSWAANLMIDAPNMPESVFESPYKGGSGTFEEPRAPRLDINAPRTAPSHPGALRAIPNTPLA